MISRIRIIHLDGTISVRDLAFSQLCALLKPLDRAGHREFLNKVPVDVPDVGNVKLVRDDL